MATTAVANGWLKGTVKAVPSGDSLVIMASSKAEIPPEKTITLSSLMAPRLARRRGTDEPFAWESREFLRKLCIGKDVTFRVDFLAQNGGREFGSVFIGKQNVAFLVVAAGWAKVKDQPSKGEPSEFLPKLQGLEDQAKKEGLGRWSKTPGASEASIRDLPPSSIADPSNLDVRSLLDANKGKPLEALVEQVRDGSTLRVYLLPKFQFVQVFVAGIQAPSMGRRASQGSFTETAEVSDGGNGEAPAESGAPLTSAKKLAASSAVTYDVTPDPFGREAKHFTETRVLSREVRIVLEGVDKFSNLIGSVYYPDGESSKDLAIELVENGFAKYVEWSACLLELDAKRQLKDAELQAKKKRLRMWTNYVQRESNSKAIQDQNFTGKVIEVITGDCVIVADDSLPVGDSSAEKRVNLSSIRCPKMRNSRKDEKPEPYAREAKEYLRTRLIGRQVHVVMEYSRKVGSAEGLAATSASNKREMSFGSIFLPSKEGVAAPPAPTASGQSPAGANVSELLVVRGFATVIRHRDFEERSNFYDALLAAESRATAGKKGIHSAKDAPSMNVTDLTTATVKKAKDFLPFLQRNRKMAAVVEYVLSGHRFKLFIPKETCSITFSLSGVRCPGRNEPFSDEAIALMRRKIMQRDVEIEVETVDEKGTFLGSLWESKTNVTLSLLEAGLAKLQGNFATDKNPDINFMTQAEQSAKKKKLKMWENVVEGEVVSNAAPSTEKRRKEELQVVVTEVLCGGKLYVQPVADQQVAAIQNQLASLNLEEVPVDDSFKPKRGDTVLAQYSADNSWYRVMIVNAPKGAAESSNLDEYEVFYIDYGNQEVIPFSRLRPIDPSVSSSPGLAQLCVLAYIKTPNEEDDYGQEAGMKLSEYLLGGSKEFKAVIEEKDSSGGKVKGQGTGTIFMVTLIDPESDLSVNALMLKEGLSRLERRRRFGPKGKQSAMKELEKYEEEAKTKRLGMWEYGDIQSDDEDVPPFRKPAGRR